MFYTKGDQISVEQGEFRKDNVKISRDVFLEKDKSKNCQNYTNFQFASYKDVMNNTGRTSATTRIWLQYMAL